MKRTADFLSFWLLGVPLLFVLAWVDHHYFGAEEDFHHE
jgi:hypothetical protein